MKMIIVIALMSSFLMSACSSLGLSIGTSVVPGVYIGTSGTLDLDKKADTQKKQVKEESVNKKEEEI